MILVVTVARCPSNPQLISMGHSPAVVLDPTVHVQETLPSGAALGSRPEAELGPDLYWTMILHSVPGDVLADRVALFPRGMGEVRETITTKMAGEIVREGTGAMVAVASGVVVEVGKGAGSALGAGVAVGWGAGVGEDVGAGVGVGGELWAGTPVAVGDAVAARVGSRVAVGAGTVVEDGEGAGSGVVVVTGGANFSVASWDAAGTVVAVTRGVTPGGSGVPVGCDGEHPRRANVGTALARVTIMTRGRPRKKLRPFRLSRDQR